MKNIYIASRETTAITSLCASFARKLITDGKKVSYFIPVSISDSHDRRDNRDIEIFREVLNLENSVNEIRPLTMTRAELWRNMTENPEEFARNIKEKFERIARNQDIVVIEGVSGLSSDNVSTLACYRITELLDSRVMVVLQDSLTLSPSDVIRVAEELKRRLLGEVISLVIESKIEKRKLEIKEMFTKATFNVLGLLPEVRNIFGFSVKQLSDLLGGQILTCPEQAEKLVSNIMVGALTLDPGTSYFERKKDKAVIVRGERADMQLAALQTSTSCLILTDNVKPIDSVLFEAQRKHIPLMVVPEDILHSVHAIEQTVGADGFLSPAKLKVFTELLSKHLDFNAIKSGLDLQG